MWLGNWVKKKIPVHLELVMSSEISRALLGVSASLLLVLLSPENKGIRILESYTQRKV
jgi:hypothetical protein